MTCASASAAWDCGRMHQVVEREDTPAVRGMIHKVRHLVEVVE